MKKTNVRVNDRIRSAQVRLIDPDGTQLGVNNIKDALKIADDFGLDLVEIAPSADPPVCRIMDYGKFKYEQTQKAKKAKRHQSTIVIKEIKLRPKIENHDFETKKKHVTRFLRAGAKVKVTIMFRGREMAHTDLGRKLLERLAEDVKTLGTMDSMPKLDGRNMITMLSPLPEIIAEIRKKKGEANAENEDSSGSR